MRKHRSAEFIPLSRATSFAENKDVRVDHIRIKGTNGDLLLDPSKSLSRKTSDFNRDPDIFAFAIKLLMRAYVLVSCNDQPKGMWLPLQSAIKHINAVETFARACARVHYGLHPKLLEAEMSARKEWHRVATADPALSLEEIIELVSHRRSIWPPSLEIKPTNTTQR